MRRLTACGPRSQVPIELPAKKSSRILEIVNSSETPVPYLLYGIETNGLFKLTPVRAAWLRSSAAGRAGARI